MRKALIVLAAITVLGTLPPPALAQAPAPKVTINGLVDFVATVYNNWPQLDVTDGGRDRGTYSRERGVFTLTGEVGKTKGVWAIELDFTNGSGQFTNASGGSSARDIGVTQVGTSANFDLDTDVSGAVETKWLYLETPVTGPGSIMPFIPVPTIGRFGGQPGRGHEYKTGIIFGGDFPGATFETTWAPNVRSTLTYAQIGEALDKVIAPTQREAFAFLASVEMDVFKGLTVKPTYTFADYEGGNCGTGNNLGTEAKNGFNTNSCGTSASPTVATQTNATAQHLETRRHTLGFDVRYTSGPFSFAPTFLYQWGTQEINPVVRGNSIRHDVDIRSWILDVLGGFRTGPLNLEARFFWTPGMGAEHRVANGADIRYYQPINSGFGYMAGWSEIQTSGIDYARQLLAGARGLGLGTSPSFDKYGRIWLGFAADYALTTALTLKGLVNVSWTDENVDTSGVLAVDGITSPRLRGRQDEENFLGTELNLGLTYRFAPNVALDLIGAYMWLGDAYAHARVAAGGGCRDRVETGSPACSVDDVWKIVSRVRLTF